MRNSNKLEPLNFLANPLGKIQLEASSQLKLSELNAAILHNLRQDIILQLAQWQVDPDHVQDSLLYRARLEGQYIILTEILEQGVEGYLLVRDTTQDGRTAS